MNTQVKITFNDLSIGEFDSETPLYQIAKFYQPKMPNPIIGVKINNQVVDMNVKVAKDTVVNFFDVNDLNGYKMYQAGLKFVMIAALKELYGDTAYVSFENSIEKGIMCYINSKISFTAEDTAKLKAKMIELIEKDLPITKMMIGKKEAIAFFESVGELEKAINIRNIPNSLVILYKLLNSYNYFYVDMPFSTGVLSKFEIHFLSDNQTALMFPSPRSDNEVPEYVHSDLIFNIYKDYKEWVKTMNLEYVSAFNKVVSDSNAAEYILRNEIRYDNKLIEITNEIVSKIDKIRLVLIAGPSSAGKTTSTKKLALNLRARGINTLTISVDDYYKEMDDRPTDAQGNKDFESLDSIDTELFNHHLLNLINGEEVDIPVYNFLTGKKEYDEKPIRIDSKTLIIIEGLHCMNEKLTSRIAREAKYKIYLSPFTPLSMDRHNHVSSIDLRLIRRMVRDNRTRGYDVSNTIRHWQKVREGEEKNIFPFIEEADIVLNTALIYELGVLKVYAEPLLFSVDVNSPYYEEARRLIGFLKGFFPVPSEFVPKDSILREFVGMGNFE